MDLEFSSISQPCLNLERSFIAKMKGHQWCYKTTKNFCSSCTGSGVFGVLKSEKKILFWPKMDLKFSSISQPCLNLEPWVIAQIKGRQWRYKTARNCCSSSTGSGVLRVLKSERKIHFWPKMDLEFSSISQPCLNLEPRFIAQIKGHKWRYRTVKNCYSSFTGSGV
jgi:hypothetical protein